MEKKCRVTGKGFLAIEWAFLALRPHLDDQRLTVRMDHQSLRRVLSLADSTRRLPQSRLFLLDLDLEIVYRALIKQLAEEVLSRMREWGGTMFREYYIPALILDDNLGDPPRNDCDDHWNYHPTVFKELPEIRQPDMVIQECPDRCMLLESDLSREMRYSEAKLIPLMRTVGGHDLAFDFDVEKVLIRQCPIDREVLRSPGFGYESAFYLSSSTRCMLHTSEVSLYATLRQ